MNIKFIGTIFAVMALAFNAAACDCEGHRAVNKLALASLPLSFPTFVLAPAAYVRTAFLAGKADRCCVSPEIPTAAK